MRTSLRIEGPGSSVLSGPGASPVLYANDNPPGRGGLAGLMLSAEHAANGAPVLAIRPLLGNGSAGAALHCVQDDVEIIALWRGLGRDFNLPLYLRDAGGVMTPVTPPAGMRGYARRGGSALSGRRPRFLIRRKTPVAILPENVRARGGG